MLRTNNSSYADGFDKVKLVKAHAAASGHSVINGNGVSASSREHSPPPKLERITEGSIPINLIVDRVIRKSYAEFLNLAETLPGLSNTPRKKKMLDYLLETRRQMIKLLVLVKWARVSREVDQCIDVVHFLHGQKNCFNNIVIQLQFVRHQLAGARLRNPDLRTAIDVLSTGDYPTFPNQLTNQFIPAPPITPKKALAALKDLNTLLHLRLTLHEVIPLPLSNYNIADGKVTFIVPNEWQLTITISEEFGRWWFVDFRDSNGEAVGEVMKQRVQQVLEEPFEQCKVEYGLFPMGVTEESLRALKKKAPLVEAYNILHRFHLIHSLSKLYISLHRLSVTPRFSPYIQTASSPNHDTVEFQYWIRGAPQGRNQPPRSHPVRLSIVNEEADLAFEEAVWTVPDGRTALDYERTKIGIRWIRDGADVPETELATIDLTNAEKLVEQVTKMHARTILERIAAETDGLTSWTSPQKEDLFFALIDSSRRIRISVDLLTGRILLTEMSNASGMLLPQILQNAQINLTTAIMPIQQTGPGQRRSYSVRECIAFARLNLLKSHISTLAEYKGWTSQRYAGGYIHKSDLDMFLPPQWSYEDLLFLSLGIETVVIHVLTRQGWLVDLRNLGDSAGLRVAWVEKLADVTSTTDKANWLDWLDTIRFFVRGRYAIYQFEKALDARGIEYTVTKPPSQTTLSLPLLSIKATTLIPEQSSCWAHDNIILRIVPGTETIVAVWQGKVRHSTDVEQLLSSVQMTDPLSYSADKMTFSLRFPLSEESTPDHIVTPLIKRFVSVERILQLVRQTKAVQERCKEDNVFRLGHFTLAGVECMYGVEGETGELLPVQILVGVQYDIFFRRDDPHERFKAFIPGWYNAGGGDVGILAEYLHATLPLYRELSILETTSPEQPSLEQLYNISILPKSTTSVRIYSPQGPYVVDMTLRFFTTEEYAKWMTNLQTEKLNHDKHTVWHITDVALNGEQVNLGDGVCVPLPGLQDVWNRCGSLMGPKAHWVVPLGRGMLCDAQEGGRALKGIWGCVVDALKNPNNGDVATETTAPTS